MTWATYTCHGRTPSLVIILEISCRHLGTIPCLVSDDSYSDCMHERMWDVIGHTVCIYIVYLNADGDHGIVVGVCGVLRRQVTGGKRHRGQRRGKRLRARQ